MDLTGRKKQKLALLLAATLALWSLAGCGKKAAEETREGESGAPAVSAADIDITFTARDLDVGYDEGTATKVVFDGSGATVTGSGAALDDGVLTISAEGTYLLSGRWDEGQIRVSVGKEEKVQLVLQGVTVHCSTGPALYIAQGDKVFITLAEGSENALSDGESYSLGEADGNLDGAVFSRADLTVNGSGALTVNGNYKHGIVSKDDLVITGGALTVTAVGQALSGKDCVKIGGGTFVLTSGTDAIQSSNAEDAGRGFVYIAGGDFTLRAGNDGVQAETVLWIDGGTFEVVSGGGSANASTDAAGEAQPGWGQWGGDMPGGERPGKGMPEGMDSAPDAAPTGAQTAQTTAQQTDTAGAQSGDSAKGLKAGSELIVNGGTFDIDSSDDSLHCNGDLTVTDGTLRLSSGDDGIHADGSLQIGGGTIEIAKCYEGIEGLHIDISSGEIGLVASDDGLNAAGGNDGSSLGGRPGQNSFAGDGDAATISISGGVLRIDAAGDGIDSNGSLQVSGGTVYVDGPTDGGNGALDYDGSGEVSGGTVVAVGSVGMAMGFTSGSTQGSILCNFPSPVAAGTEFALKDSAGNTLASYIPQKAYQSVAVSCPAMKQGESYTLCAGSQTAEVTLSELATTYGQGGMGGGQMGGAPGQQGGRMR